MTPLSLPKQISPPVDRHHQIWADSNIIKECHTLVHSRQVCQCQVHNRVVSTPRHLCRIQARIPCHHIQHPKLDCPHTQHSRTHRPQTFQCHHIHNHHSSSQRCHHTQGPHLYTLHRKQHQQFSMMVNPSPFNHAVRLRGKEAFLTRM